MGSVRGDGVVEESSWAELRQRRMGEPGAEEAYRDAQLCYELGCNVRILRERRGLSQSRLARSAGLTQSEVARVEAGGSSPSLPALDRLAQALDAELVVRLEPRPDPPPTD